MKYATPFISGLLFAVGLGVAGMTLPSKVLGFLDITGRWDPSLAFVMAGAIGVYASAFWYSRRKMRRPVVEAAFSNLPAARIDARLLIGAAVFGVGWGLAGYCPGPAIVSATNLALPAVVLCVSMLAGFWITRRLERRMRRKGESPLQLTHTEEIRA